MPKIIAQTQDVKRIQATISPDFEAESIDVSMTVSVEILEPTKVIYLDSKISDINEVNINDVIQNFNTEDNKLNIMGDFIPKTYEFRIEYTHKPKQTLYFVNDLGVDQLFTQGQGKYTSHWLPSIDDMNDKIEFDLTVIAPKDMTVISNGKLLSAERDSLVKRSQFDMTQPMSSYLVALAIGHYDYKTLISNSEVSLELYYEPKDAEKFESTYRYSKQIFDFLEEEIGVAYPWQDYKQVYVKDFLYAGMENTTATIFSDAFVVDEIGFIDRNYVNVNAHELAHQWFGDLVTEESSTHHWLHEGFATYYALLAEREIFGDEYYYWKLYESAERLKEMSDSGKGEALMNPKASSLTFYEKGAWALHILRERVGDEAFKMGVKSYLEKHAYSNVTVDDFLAEVQKHTDYDLQGFKKDWLEQSAFKAEEALESLSYSEFLGIYFEFVALRQTPLQEKKDMFFDYLSNEYLRDEIGQEIVLQLTNEPITEVIPLLRMAFSLESVLVRQSIAASFTEIPKDLQSEFESLLNDNSYQTKELALFSLWQSFPQKRKQYLDVLKGVEGFSDKNVELLWLTLHLATQDYEPSRKSAVFQKLTGYTNEQYAFQIRENAFNYLYQIDAFSDESLGNLMSATTHHVWRFKKFSRELLKELLKNADYKKRIIQLKATFSASENAYLDTLLK